MATATILASRAGISRHPFHQVPDHDLINACPSMNRQVLSRVEWLLAAFVHHLTGLDTMRSKSLRIAAFSLPELVVLGEHCCGLVTRSRPACWRHSSAIVWAVTAITLIEKSDKFPGSLEPPVL